MRKATVFMALLLVFSVSLSYAAGSGTKDTTEYLTEFYIEHIDMKIAAAERNTEWADSRYEDLRCLAKHAKIEADFYKNNKEQLVKEMKELNLQPKDYKVHYFLINAFHEAYPEAENMCR